MRFNDSSDKFTRTHILGGGSFLKFLPHDIRKPDGPDVLWPYLFNLHGVIIYERQTECQAKSSLESKITRFRVYGPYFAICGGFFSVAVFTHRLHHPCLGLSCGDLGAKLKYIADVFGRRTDFARSG